MFRVQDVPRLAGFEVIDGERKVVGIKLTRVLFHSETAPTEGTLRVFPDVGLANGYLILRPFFRPLVYIDDPGILDPKNWEYGTP